MNKQVTRKDVAARAGVSISVVSRALNNSGYVAEDKKKKILEVAQEMNYVPHVVAMSLQQRRTKQILFFCKDLHNSFNIDLYYGMVEEARRRGYMALLNGNLEFDDIKQVMVDGIILQNEFLAQRYAEANGKNYYLPVVSASFGNLTTLPKAIPVIEWDLYSSMELAIDYLRKHGHRKIAYAGPYPYSDVNSRINSWKNCMKTTFGNNLEHYYLDICDVSEVTQRDSTYGEIMVGEEKEETFTDKGHLAADVYYKRNLDATAIVCFNDELAIGLIQELQKKGYRIPEDISVVGFDGSFSGRNFEPRITTFSPDNKNYGEKLAGLLIDVIEEKKIHYYTKQMICMSDGDTVKDLR